MPLVVDDVEVVALRHILAGLVDVVGHTPGHLHHIAIGDGRDGDAHGGLPAYRHPAPGRTGVALLDSGEIAQAEVVAGPRDDRQVLYLLEAAEAAGRLHTQAVGRGLDGARVDDAVLSLEGRGDVRQGDAAPAEQGGVDRHLDGAVLEAEQLDLRHVLDAEQVVLERPGLVLHLAVGAGGAAQAIEDAQHVAEVVVHHRGAGAGGQLRLCVAHLASQLVPELLHILGPDLLFHVDGDFREARPVVALQVIELAERLDRLLEDVGHLLAHLHRRGAGIAGRHQCLLDREGRVLQLAHVQVGEEASRQDQSQQEPAQRPVAQEKSCEVSHILSYYIYVVTVGWLRSRFPTAGRGG